MAKDAMFHMFAGRSGMHLLKMQKEYYFYILRQICQLFFGIIEK